MEKILEVGRTVDGQIFIKVERAGKIMVESPKIFYEHLLQNANDPDKIFVTIIEKALER